MFIAVPHGMVVRLSGFIEMVTPVTCKGAVKVGVGERAGEALALADGEVAAGVEELLPVPPLGPPHALALSPNKHIQSINIVERLNI